MSCICMTPALPLNLTMPDLIVCSSTSVILIMQVPLVCSVFQAPLLLWFLLAGVGGDMRRPIAHVLLSAVLLSVYLPWSYCHPVDIFSHRILSPTSSCSDSHQTCDLLAKSEGSFPRLSEDDMDLTEQLPLLQSDTGPDEEDPGIQNLFTVSEPEREHASSRPRRISPAGKPTSLDLTFHLLRELMETSRSEKMSQKTRMNKKLLQALGK